MAIFPQSTYFFKSPDTNVSGDYKIVIVACRKEPIKTFFKYSEEDIQNLEYLGFDQDFLSQNAYQLQIRVNGKYVWLSTDEETFTLPSFEVEISPDTKISVDITNDLQPLVSIRQKREVVVHDRVVSEYWDDEDFSQMSESEWVTRLIECKKEFAKEVQALAERLNDKRLHHRGFNERLKRLYRRHFGSDMPKMSIKEINTLGGE